MESDFENPNNVFQIGVIPRRIDIITDFDGVQYSQAAKKKLKLKINGLTIPVLSISDLCKNKLSTGRKNDHLDADLIKKHYRELGGNE